MKQRGNIKKWLALLLTAACTVTASGVFVFADTIDLNDTAEVSAAEISEDVDVNTKSASAVTEAELAKAADINIGKEVTGHIDKNPDKDSLPIYKFIPNKTGTYTFTASSNVTVEYSIFDVPGYHKGLAYDSGHSKSVEDDLDLLADVPYYISVGDSSVSNDTDFSFTVSECKKEVKGSDPQNPRDVKLDGKKNEGVLYPLFRNNGSIYNYVDNGPLEFGCHYYHFNIQKNGRLTFDTTSSEKGVYYRIKDSKDFSKESKFVWTAASGSDHSSTGNEKFIIDLIPGDYYLQVRADSDDSNYSFSMSFAEIKPGTKEVPCFDTEFGGSNSEQEKAFPIKLNTTYVAQSTYDNRNKNDWYSFTLPSSAPIYVTLSTEEVGSVGWYLFKKGFNDLTDGVSLFGDIPVVYAPTGNAEIDQKVKCKSSTTELYGSSADWQAKKPTVFPAGDYWFCISKGSAQDGYGHTIGATGAYRLMLSTSKNGAKSKPASKIQLSNTAMTLSENEIGSLTATVTPKDADDTSLTVTVDNEDVIKVLPLDSLTQDGNVTSYSIEALKTGVAKVTFTANGSADPKKPVTATCTVSVTTEKSTGLVIATGQKIDLTKPEFFGPEIDSKNDKFIVTSTDSKIKGIGSVSKAWFTAKKAGEAKITRQVKVDKKYVAKESIILKIEAPKYHKDPVKKKDIKTKDVFKRNEVIMPIDMIDISGTAILPNYFVCNDKKGLVEFDAGTGMLTVLKSGTFKVTAYYGADVDAAKSSDKNVAKNAFKNAGKIEYTIKAKLPTVKDAKVKPNPVKDKAKDKTVNISVTNISKDTGALLTADSWKIYMATLDENNKPTGYDTAQLPDAEKIKLTPGDAKKNYTKASVSVVPGTEPQVVAVVVTVDEVEYPAYITIEPIKK